MQLQDALTKYGLKDKEAKVYLALLELGTAEVSGIAKRAGVIRSTTYTILETLIRQGLVSSAEKGKVQHYVPEDPNKIMAMARERVASLESVAGDLKALFAQAPVRPKVRYYEGIAGVRDMYTGILRERGLKEYQIIASEEAWLRMDRAFVQEFKRKRARAGIKTRLILEYGPEALRRKRRARESNSQIKILPKNFPWKFSAEVSIFEHRVIFIAYRGPLIAVEVQSAEIAKQQRAIFEYLWGVVK